MPSWLAGGALAGAWFLFFTLIARCFNRAKRNRPRVGPAAPAADTKTSQVAEAHAKLCLDPSGLIRRGKFGGIDLFDSPLEQQIGFMDAAALRAMYEEHVLSKASKTQFSPTPHNPNFLCTSEGEFFYVVGKDGIDMATWELKPGARPTYDDSQMVDGRNAASIEELMSSPETKRSGLRVVEIIALRLYSGKFT